MITASYLFAPHLHRPGENLCFFCGMSCDGTNPKKEFVKKTFTNRDIVKYPGSDYVCGCCVASLDTFVETTLIDGEVKTGRGGAPRTYSWLLTGEANSAFSKKHFDFARETISNPPGHPFSIVLADSGKKQIIFRAPVNYDRDVFSVQFEEDQVEIRSCNWSVYLDVATKTAAAIGKKSLLSPNNFQCFLACEKLYGSTDVLEQWIDIHTQPMAKVAAWLCESKGKQNERAIGKTEQNRNTIRTAIQTETGGGNRSPKQKRESATSGGSETTGNQLLFDFT